MAHEKEPTCLSLGLEELVLVLNLLGYPDAARGAFTSRLGEMSADEERGRLLAANHSLMARDILYLQGDQIRMKPAYARLLALLAVNDATVRGSVRRIDAPEEHLTYYIRTGRVVEQHITHDVIHAFREVTPAEARDALPPFLRPPGARPFEAAPFTLGEGALEQANALIDTEGEAGAAAFLRGLGVAEEAAALLADDLQRQTWRSAAIQARIDMTEGVSADRGYLILGGESGRAWLMDIHVEGDDSRLIIRPATDDALRKSTTALFPIS